MATKIKLVDRRVDEAPEFLNKLGRAAKAAVSAFKDKPAAAPEPETGATEIDPKNPKLLGQALKLYKELINQDFQGLKVDTSGAPLIMGGMNRDHDRRMFFATYADVVATSTNEDEVFLKLQSAVEKKIEAQQKKTAAKSEPAAPPAATKKKVNIDTLDHYGQAKYALRKLKKRFAEIPVSDDVFNKIASQILIAFKDPEVTGINLTEAKTVDIKISNLYSRDPSKPTDSAIAKAVNDWLEQDVPKYRKINIQLSKDFGEAPQAEKPAATANPPAANAPPPPAATVTSPEQPAAPDATTSTSTSDVANTTKKAAAKKRTKKVADNTAPSEEVTAKEKPKKESLYEGLFDKFLDTTSEAPENAPYKMNSKGIFKIQE